MDVCFLSLLSLTECFCYFVYFHYIYHHDNHIAAGIISQSTLKHRNKSNALSMMGQAVSLFTEIWFIVSVGIMSAIFNVPLLREVAALAKVIDFLIIPLIHIKTSEPIHNFIMQRKQNWSIGVVF